MATYARGLTSQAVNLTHTTHWSECLMYYVANACSNRNLCNWRVMLMAMQSDIESKIYQAVNYSLIHIVVVSWSTNDTVVPNCNCNWHCGFCNERL